MKKIPVFSILVLTSCSVFSQGNTQEYVKKVLETTEVELLYSYYSQIGDNAAVTGGEGTEELWDMTPTIIVSIPMGENGVLTVDGGISAYSSASSSNVNPFDGDGPASPWVESSGPSKSDVLSYFHPSYSHSSIDRNDIVSVNAAVSSEYDYFSIGFGAGYTRLFNEKNTELSIKGQVFLDSYRPQYPLELREGFFDNSIRGNGTYNPNFTELPGKKRNSYSLSLNFSQIFTKRLQASLSVDAIMQEGLLSTPHQRVYFADKEDFFIDNFQLADDVERLPFYRFKLPIGARLSYFASEWLTFRGYFRYYYDNWGVTSYTGNVELPIKLSEKFTVAPMYRYYVQTASYYFNPKDVGLSTEPYYTSDYDLSSFDAHQYGIGITYKDIFAKARLWKFGLKSISLRANHYERNNGLKADIISLGFKFIVD